MNPSSIEQERSKEIAELTRTYAQNRSLGVVVALLVFTALSAGISILSYAGGVAYREGNQLLFWTCMVALVPVLAAVVYVSVPKWGGRRLEALTSHLYREGNVSIAVPKQRGRKRIALVLGIVFGACVLGSVLLGFFGQLSPKYMQPISAIFVVPFLVGLTILMRPAVSYVSLLWPVLYGLHAILIVAGVPIAFTGRWESLNIVLPMVGYGVLAALVGHVCNRHAFSKLQQLTQSNDTDTGDTVGATER
jgi:hypothetical protein